MQVLDWFRGLILERELQISLLVSAVGVVAIFCWTRVRDFWSRRRFRTYSSNSILSEEEIRKYSSGYVMPLASFDDPSVSTAENAEMPVTAHNLFAAVDRAVGPAGSTKYLFVFADCGMGKTTFLVNYFYRRSAKFRKSGNGLYHTSLASTKSLNDIANISSEERKNAVLLLDAFDEDPLVLDGVENRLRFILSKASGFKSVVITCRSHFFENDDKIPVETDQLNLGPVAAGGSKEYKFERIYIRPFTSKQIQRFIRRAIPGPLSIARRRRARALVLRVPSVSVRPMLLAHITDVLERVTTRSSLTQSDLYQAMANAWVDRESFWVSPSELLKFSRNLATELYLERHRRGGETCSREEVVALARAWGIEMRVEHLTSRSLLNRTSDGQCKFAHRSFLEYFAVEGLMSARSTDDVPLTDQMATFLFDKLGLSGFAIPKRALGSLRLRVVGPESRLGYATNYGLAQKLDSEYDPWGIYHSRIRDASGDVIALGEHLQRMMDAGMGPFIDVRLLSQSIDDVRSEIYIAMWFEGCFVLSIVQDVAGNVRTWRAEDPRVDCLVGMPMQGRVSGDNLRWEGYGRCKMTDRELLLISKSCPSIGVAEVGFKEGVRVSLITANTSGPLRNFGILSGGSLGLVAKRDFAVFRAQDLRSRNIGKIIKPEEARTPGSEKWLNQPDAKIR